MEDEPLDATGPVIDDLDTYEIPAEGGSVIVHGRRFKKTDKVIIDGKAYTTVFKSTIRLILEVRKSNNMRMGTYGLSVGNLTGRRSNTVFLMVG